MVRMGRLAGAGWAITASGRMLELTFTGALVATILRRIAAAPTGCRPQIIPRRVLC